MFELYVVVRECINCVLALCVVLHFICCNGYMSWCLYVVVFVCCDVCMLWCVRCLQCGFGVRVIVDAGCAWAVPCVVCVWLRGKLNLVIKYTICQLNFWTTRLTCAKCQAHILHSRTTIYINKSIVYDGGLYYKSKHLPPRYDKRSCHLLLTHNYMCEWLCSVV